MQAKGLTKASELISGIMMPTPSAVMAAMKLLFDRGLRVPEDCSLIAIDGIELTNYCVPTLTTLEQPADEMALACVKILVSLLRGDGKNRHVFMETRLREGASVRSV